MVFVFTSSFYDASKVVSDDGKKVRRKDPFTEKDKEELQVGIMRLPMMGVTKILEKFFLVMFLLSCSLMLSLQRICLKITLIKTLRKYLVWLEGWAC
jgi:hypothetical protein